MFPLASFMSRMTGIAATAGSFIVNLIAATCARATIRTVWNGGLLETVAINVAAISDGDLSVADSGTNICLQSEDIQTTWLNGAGSTPTPLSYLEGNTLFSVYRVSQGLSVASSAEPYTLQCVVDSSSDRFLQLGISIAGSDWGIATFDLAGLTIDELVGAAGTVSQSSIEKMNATEYLCSMTYTPGSASTAREIVVGLSDLATGFTPGSRGSAAYDGDGTSMLYVSKIHVEAASFITPYIKTTTGTGTRAADICTVPVSSVHSITQGAERLQFTPAATGQVNKYLRSFFVDATHRIDLYINATQVIAFYVDGANTSSATFTYSHLVAVPMFADIYWDSILNELGVRADAVSGDIDAKVFQTGTFAGMTALPAASDIGNKASADVAQGLFVSVVDYASKGAAGW